MKFNWGTGITIFIILFVTFILSFVFVAARTNTELYAEDYYQQELDYQETITAKSNATDLNAETFLTQGTKSVILHFPENLNLEKIAGQVLFYRANDASMDKTFPLVTENGKMIMPKEDLSPGTYHVKISWEEDDKHYLINKEIIIE
jgi:hypothetical protein